MRPRLRVLAVTLTLGSLAPLSACGLGLGRTDMAAAQETDAARPASETTRVPQGATPIAPPTDGSVRVDGTTRGSLTVPAVERFAEESPTATVKVGSIGATPAFQRLCAGALDVVDSARAISADELALCSRYGQQVVQLQVAADAVVLATRAETDLGGDCLTVDQVADLYRAGSQVTRWSQLGFAGGSIPVVVGGPDPENNAFDFFGRYVLDAPEPSLTYLRSDYRAQADDQAVRRFLTGDPRDRVAAAQAPAAQRARTQAATLVRQRRAELSGARTELSVALRERAKGVRDRRPSATQRRDAARVSRARVARAAAERRLALAVRQLRIASSDARSTAAAEKRERALLGRVAYVRSSYYHLFEDQLRPLEISAGGTADDCVFPSDTTVIGGQYPLGRRLLLTTTMRALDRPEVAAFLASYLAHARETATAKRLIALPRAQIRTQLAWVRGEQAPPVLTAAAASAPSSGGASSPTAGSTATTPMPSPTSAP